jgi:signal transduction histidine kinase
MAGRTTRSRVMGPAETRVVRVTGLGFLPGAVVFGLLAVGPISAQDGFQPAWWMLAASALILVPPIRLLRAVGAVSVMGTIAAEATLPFFTTLPHGGFTGGPWIQQLSSIGAVSAVIVWRPVTVLCTTFAVAALATIDRALTTSPHLWLNGVQDGIYVLLFVITFVAFGVSTLASGRAVDVAAAEAARASTAAAVEAVREREQVRVNLLVHDRVLATLLAASRGSEDGRELAQRDAGRALADLHALIDPSQDESRLSGEHLVWALQGATTEIAPEAVFGYEIEAERIRFAAEPVEALTSALEEALRNSLLHAGDANRTVHVRIATNGVHVDVLDDGYGFEPSEVPSTRLGISQSILGRMRALDGGDADIVSERGVGTRVVMRFVVGGAA